LEQHGFVYTTTNSVEMGVCHGNHSFRKECLAHVLSQILVRRQEVFYFALFY